MAQTHKLISNPITMPEKPIIWRGIIGFILGVALVFLALKFKDRIVASKKQPAIKVEKQVKKVITDTVRNSSIPVEIIEKGTLQALRKVELYSEVQGIMKPGQKLFKPGQSYREGEWILEIDDSEFLSSLKAERSVIYNQIAQAMPDIRLDYPEHYGKWSAYLGRFDVNTDVPPLPSFDEDKERFFINSKGIVTSYYKIRNLEERLKKFRIKAPFYCLLTEAMVFPGALVRPGQKLGEIISPAVYEMAVSVDASYINYIQTDQQVKLRDLEAQNTWTGRVVRIDPVVNTVTQGITAYIEVRGKGLKAGMFLEAIFSGTPVVNSFELSRKLLIENKSTFVVRGDSLALIPLTISFFKESTAVVSNLKDGDIVLKNPVPGAYDGMLIEVINP